MSFARKRVPGAWLLGDTIDPAELEYFDASIANAVDGDAGGAYALSGDLILGGDPGITFEVELRSKFQDLAEFYDNLYAYNGLLVYEGLSVEGLASFAGDIVAGQDLDVYGWTTLHDNVYIEDQLTIRSTADFFVYCQSGFYNRVFFEAGSQPLFEDDATHNGRVTLNKPVTVGSGGAIKARTLSVATSTPAGGVSPLQYDKVVLEAGSYPSGGVALIKDTGAEDDMVMTFYAKNTGSPVFLQSPSGTLCFLSSLSGGSGSATQMRRVEVQRQGGAWRVLDADPA